MGQIKTFIFYPNFSSSIIPVIVVLYWGLPRAPPQSNLLFTLSITSVTSITTNTFIHHTIHHTQPNYPSHQPFLPM